MNCRWDTADKAVNTIVDILAIAHANLAENPTMTEAALGLARRAVADAEMRVYQAYRCRCPKCVGSDQKFQTQEGSYLRR